MPGMTIAHYPPADERGAERLRTATTAWSGLIGELHAVGLRPYLELEHGEHDDPLRLYCDLDNDLLLDVTIGDEGIPDTPARSIDGDWIVFIPLSCRVGGESSVREVDVDAGAAEVDHRDQGVG